MKHFYSRRFRTAERASLEFCHFLNPSLVLVIRLCALTGLAPLPYAGRICFALMYPQGGFGPKSKRLKSIMMMPNFLFVMLTAPYAYHFGASLKISTPSVKPSLSKVSHIMSSITPCTRSSSSQYTLYASRMEAVNESIISCVITILFSINSPIPSGTPSNASPSHLLAVSLLYRPRTDRLRNSQENTLLARFLATFFHLYHTTLS